MFGYLMLALCIAFNVIGCMFLTASDGMSKPFRGILGAALGVLSYVFFAKSVPYINISIGYSLFAGIGIIISSLISVFVFKQKLSRTGVVCAGVIAAGIVYIHMFGTI